MAPWKRCFSMKMGILIIWSVAFLFCQENTIRRSSKLDSSDYYYYEALSKQISSAVFPASSSSSSSSVSHSSDLSLVFIDIEPFDIITSSSIPKMQKPSSGPSRPEASNMNGTKRLGSSTPSAPRNGRNLSLISLRTPKRVLVRTFFP